MSEWSVVAIILEFQAQPNDLRQPIAPATDTLVNPSQVPNIYGSNVGQLTKLISPVSIVHVCCAGQTKQSASAHIISSVSMVPMLYFSLKEMLNRFYFIAF